MCGIACVIFLLHSHLLLLLSQLPPSVGGLCSTSDRMAQCLRLTLSPQWTLQSHHNCTSPCQTYLLVWCTLLGLLETLSWEWGPSASTTMPPQSCFVSGCDDLTFNTSYSYWGINLMWCSSRCSSCIQLHGTVIHTASFGMDCEIFWLYYVIQLS